MKQGKNALDAFDAAEKEKAERKEKGFMPFRLWLAQGEEVEVIVLDDAFVSDEPGVGGVLIKEHNLRGADGKWGNFESCCSDFANCPLCDKAGTDGFGHAAYTVLLTVLVLKEWTSKTTGEKHTYSKMLLPIKAAQKDTWLALQKQGEKEQGSMRGMYLVLRRAKGEQTVATGEPIMLDNGKLYDLITEEELVKDYGHPAIKSRDGGKIIKQANEDLQPFDYQKLFPAPDPDDLASRFGGRNHGSRRSVAQEWEKGQAEQQPEAAPPGRRRARAGAAEGAEPEPQAAEEPAPAAGPARRRGAAASTETAAPAGPARRRGGAGTSSPPPSADGNPGDGDAW